MLFLHEGFLFFEGTETDGTGFAQWVAETMDKDSVELLAGSAVQIQDLVARGDVPNVGKSNVCKLTSPAHGNADTAQGRAYNVTQVLPEIETFVTEVPDTVNTADSFRLCESILEHL